MLKKLFPNEKILTPEAIKKIKEGNEEILTKLYFHTNDLVQKTLIEMICELKGFSLEVIEPEEPSAA